MSAEKIPIANIYYLLCYAWDHSQETHYAQVRSENCDRMEDLLARVLTRSVQQLIKRGLHRDYLFQQERRVLPRGKILIGENLRRPPSGSLARICQFDELSADILPNRIIRATLEVLHRGLDLRPELRADVLEVARFFATLTPLRLDNGVFRRVQIDRNMRHYRFVLEVCQFIHAQLLPTSTEGVSRFRDFRTEDARMGALFEQFVFNFYAQEQSSFRVTAPQIPWAVEPSLCTERGETLLPRMRTDICLEGADDHLIIDCKFYRDAFQWNFDRPKFISANLYQLFTYLKNQAACRSGWERARGLLLYPVVDAPFDETVHLHGHSIRVAAIDLGQGWRRIHSDLLALIGRDARLPASPVV